MDNRKPQITLRFTSTAKHLAKVQKRHALFQTSAALSTMEISPFPPRHEPEASPEPELETVTAPLVTDVLFGRDKIMFNHVGNVRFRLVIQSRAKEYEHAPSRRVKSSIVYSVVQNVHGYGGRFLKKEKDKTWKVVTVTEAIQKVSISPIFMLCRPCSMCSRIFCL